MRRIFDDESDQYLLTHYAAQGASSCATHLGLSIRQISSRMGYLRKRDGVSAYIPTEIYRREHSKGLKRHFSTKKPKVDPEQFIHVTTPEAAYILGLLWADGCVSTTKNGVQTIIINMVKEDMEPLLPIFLKTGPWAHCGVIKKSGRPQIRISTGNRPLGDYLVGHRYRSKNQTTTIVSTIPKHLRPYWFRGLVDGDGCFCFFAKAQSVSICGPFDQDWSYLTELLIELGVSYRVRVTGSIEKGRRSTVTMTNLPSVCAFGAYIYQGREADGIGLERKYAKLKQIEQRYANSTWYKRRKRA